MWTIKHIETVFSYLFCPWKYRRNTSKSTSRILNSKTEEIFSTALTAQSAQKPKRHKVHLSFYSTWDIKRWSLYAMNFVCITFSTIIDLTTPSTILAAGNFAFFPFDFSCTKSQSLVCNTTLESSMQWIGILLRDLIFWPLFRNCAWITLSTFRFSNDVLTKLYLINQYWEWSYYSSRCIN